MHSRHTSTGRDLCLFALPMLIGNILQSCYAMADMAVVGCYVGADALAAVSNTAMISFISAALAMGFTMGGTVLVARFRGAGDARGQRETVQTLFAVSALGGALLTAVNYALYPPVLALMRVGVRVRRGLCIAEAVSPLAPCLLVLFYYEYGKWRRVC